MIANEPGQRSVGAANSGIGESVENNRHRIQRVVLRTVDPFCRVLQVVADPLYTPVFFVFSMSCWLSALLRVAGICGLSMHEKGKKRAKYRKWLIPVSFPERQVFRARATRSLAAIFTKSARESAFIFWITRPQCALTVISLMPSSLPAYSADLRPPTHNFAFAAGGEAGREHQGRGSWGR